MLTVTEVQIRNFRVLKDVTIPFKQHMVLVGENNVGKTALLELMQIILSPTSRGIQISEEDFHHDADPSSDSIEVTIELRPATGDEFEEPAKQFFYPHVDIEPDGRERLLVHVEARYDQELESIRVTARFKKSDNKFDEGSFLPYRKNIPYFMVDAIRDVRKELSSRQGLWSRLAKTRPVEAEKREAIRKIGEEAGKRLLETALGDKAFQEMIEDFTGFLKSILWFEAQAASFEFSIVPEDSQDFVRSLELRLQNPGDSKASPVLSHGVGTQSLTVFALFLAYTKALGLGQPILAVEEPEAHLHPQAQRALTRQLMGSSIQTIVSTHSTFVSDLVKPTEVVLLKRTGNRASARFVKEGYLDETEERTLSRYIRGSTSEFYFARCVVLVEGDSDRSALPIFARAKGEDFDRLGISIVQVQGQNFKPFMKLFAQDALDIPWIILCDNDRAITDCLRHAVDLGVVTPPREVPDIESRRPDLENKGIFFYPVRGDFEWFLLREGFAQEYEEAISEVHGDTALDSWVAHTSRNRPELANATREEQIREFIRSRRGGRKPELAAVVAAKITGDESDASRIPAYLHRVIEEAVKTAREEILRGSGGDSSGQSG